jgi:hypothetical protein
MRKFDSKVGPFFCTIKLKVLTFMVLSRCAGVLLSELNQRFSCVHFKDQALMRSTQSVNEPANNIADVMLATLKRRAWEETEHRRCVCLPNEVETRLRGVEMGVSRQFRAPASLSSCIHSWRRSGRHSARRQSQEFLSCPGNRIAGVRSDSTDWAGRCIVYT